MRFHPVAMILIGAALSAEPAVAAEPTPSKTEAKPEPQSKVICRKEAETGSILKKRRVCYTKRDWDRAEQASRDAMTTGQMSGSASGQ